MDKDGFLKAYEMLKTNGIIKRQKDVAELTEKATQIEQTISSEHPVSEMGKAKTETF